MMVSHLSCLLRTLLGSSARGLGHQAIFPVPRQPPDDRQYKRTNFTSVGICFSMRFNFSISVSVFTDQLIAKYNFNHRKIVA